MAADAAAQARRGQLHGRHLFLQAEKAAFVAASINSLTSATASGEADRGPLLARCQAETQGNVRLAGPTWPEGVMSKTCLSHGNVLAPLDPFAAGEFQHLHLVELGDRLEGKRKLDGTSVSA